MSDPPTLVFIPGSWHRPTCYNAIINLLQKQHNLKCVSVTLPSTTGNPHATFKDDLDAAQEAISNETAQGRDVILIAHSYGGMVGNSAINGFTRLQDATTSQVRQPRAGFVIGIVLIASGFTITGLAFMDPFFGRPPPFWRVNNATGYAELVASPRELFYHDLPAEDAEFWVSQLTTQSLKALFEGGEYTYAGWEDVPVWYIGTIEDRGLPVMVQRIQIGVARELGCNVEHRELKSSHSPFLSQPHATTSIILEAVSAFTGKSWGKERTISEVDSSVVFPRFMMGQPSTWLRYGLPLGVGHVLGRCFLFLRWARGWASRTN